MEPNIVILCLQSIVTTALAWTYGRFREQPDRRIEELEMLLTLLYCVDSSVLLCELIQRAVVWV